MLIVLNHKMNLSIDEIKKYEVKLRDYDVVVMPQTPYMGLFSSGKYTLGSQCISEYTATGGISSEALVSLKVKYVLVGHYERRSIQKDTEEVILKKIKETLKYKMIPILCIGETLEQRNNNEYKESLKIEIDNVYSNIENEKENIIIAYEPVWNIGFTNELNIEEIESTIKEIKEYIEKEYKVIPKVLYGGGVNYDSSLKLKNIDILDGLVIGTASLDINNIIDICNIFKSQ